MAAERVQQVTPFPVRRYSRNGVERVTDTVTREEPLEIRLTYSFKSSRRTESAAVTMRTPGHEAELAAGFLFSEGVLARKQDIVDIRLLGAQGSNEVLVEVTPEVDVESWHLRRATLISSACGICGKRTAESIPKPEQLLNDDLRIAQEMVYELPALLRRKQQVFGMSGGLHAAGLVTPGGEMITVFEDVGRHNALDKLIGSCLLGGTLPLRDRILFMSSRSSFELVQKATAAECSVLITIGAPSSLAIEFAHDRGMTLAGFVREDHFNVYSGEWRVTS